MLVVYTIGGLFLLYLLATFITHWRFRNCTGESLSSTLPTDFNDEQLQQIRADAFFQRGCLFHEKGLFEAALTAYQNCTERDKSHSLAFKYQKLAQSHRLLPSIANNETNLPLSNIDSEEFSPLKSVVSRQESELDGHNVTPQTSVTDNTALSLDDVDMGVLSEELLDFSLPTVKKDPLSQTKERGLDLYKNGMAMSAQKRWGEAIIEYTNALEAYPHMPQAYISRAKALLKEGRTDDAISDYSRLIELDPKNGALYYKRGNAFLHKNDLDEAIDDYSTALKFTPNSPKSLNRRGTAYFRKKDVDLAIADFTRAIILDPGFAAAYSNRGIARNQMGLKDQAQQDFIRVESLRYKTHSAGQKTATQEELAADIKTVLNQALLDIKNRDEEKALLGLNRVIEAAPNNSTAYFQRACIHLDHRRLESAVSDFSDAIACQPDFGEAYSKRGQANILSNLYIDAINDFDRAIELLPDHLESYLNRGRANSQRGLRDSALADFTKAIVINPKSDIAFYNRGLEWQNLGEVDKALKDLDHACQLGNNAACIASSNLLESL